MVEVARLRFRNIQSPCNLTNVYREFYYRTNGVTVWGLLWCIMSWRRDWLITLLIKYRIAPGLCVESILHKYLGREICCELQAQDTRVYLSLGLLEGFVVLVWVVQSDTTESDILRNSKHFVYGLWQYNAHTIKKLFQGKIISEEKNHGWNLGSV